DVELRDLMAVTGRLGQVFDSQIREPKAIAITHRLTKRRADATGSAGQKDESFFCHGQSWCMRVDRQRSATDGVDVSLPLIMSNELILAEIGLADHVISEQFSSGSGEHDLARLNDIPSIGNG